MGDSATVPQGEQSTEQWINNLVVEAIGTFALIFLGVSTITMTNGMAGNLIAIALAHGLAIALMVAASGHISGGAFNPAVTLALFIARQMSAVKALAYMAAQLVGATLGAVTVLAVFPQVMTDAVNLGVPSVGAPFTTTNAFIAEVIATFFLVYVIFGVAVDARGPATIAGLCIGLMITVDIFATGAISGAAMNPARWFGPALVHGTWANGWIWLTAPFIGAVLAGGVYQYLYLRKLA